MRQERPRFVDDTACSRHLRAQAKSDVLLFHQANARIAGAQPLRLIHGEDVRADAVELQDSRPGQR
eukprot:3586608-Pyramimonas_sp.AAC.1